MNETKHNIEISGAIIEQLSSLNEEEPTKYWRTNIIIRDFRYSNGIRRAFTTESAAWGARERALANGMYLPCGSSPVECTKDELDAVARSTGDTKVEVLDETGAVVDWWSVQ